MVEFTRGGLRRIAVAAALLLAATSLAPALRPAPALAAADARAADTAANTDANTDASTAPDTDTGAGRAASFTPAQRAEIVRIVRDALKTDPDILGEAIVALRASDERRQQADADAAIRANRAALSGQPGDAILGNPAGTVTLVEFYDPRCPYCRKVLPDLDALLRSDHSVRLVEKLIPILGPNSVVDARAIQAAARQGRYAALQRALMTDNGPPGLDRVKAIAGRVGLDVPQLLRDMNGAEVTDVLDRNIALAHTLHLTGTPTFVAGNEMIPGAAELSDLQAMIAAARRQP